MSSPQQLFCKVLEQQYNTEIDTIEAVLYLPVRALRDVKSNIKRVENLVYNSVLLIVEKYEKQLLEILFLNKINQLEENVNNFCQVAFSCQALVTILTDPDNDYLSFLDQATKDQIASNYALFEQYVCVLGLKRIVNSFVDDILSEIRAILVTLSDRLENALRLTEMIEAYQDILDSSGIIDLLNYLRAFLNCAFSSCNYAESANNALNNYMEKLALSDNGSTFTQYLNSLLDGYN